MEKQNPNGQNLQISLLKSNLDMMKSEFTDQHSQISSLDEGNEQCFQKTIVAKRKVVAFNDKAEKLKAENIKLQVQRQVQLDKLTDIRKEINDVCTTSDEMQSGLQQNELYELCQLGKFVDVMQEINDRYRKAPAFYDEVELKMQIESDEKILSELQMEENRMQKKVADLKSELNDIEPSVPENILDIVGQKILTNKLNALSAEFENVRANIIR